MLSSITPTFIIAVLLALSVHEWAHAFVAHKLGDSTAEDEGRLTLNPLAHLDPVGTILFLFVGFGWGKPVPVNPGYFRHPIRDGALVALAGPASNLLLAFIAVVIARLTGIGESLFFEAAGTSVGWTFLSKLLSDVIGINLVLMAFNLLPIPPLDGSKIIRLFIPYEHEYEFRMFEYYGPWVLLALIVAGRALGFPLLSFWIDLIVNPIYGVILAIL